MKLICVDVKMICVDVKLRRCEDDMCTCLEDRMWRCEDVMCRCEDEMMRRHEDHMCRGEEDKMWRCEDVKVICLGVNMRRCEDVKFFSRPSLLEEPFAPTLSGKSESQSLGRLIWRWWEVWVGDTSRKRECNFWAEWIEQFYSTRARWVDRMPNMFESCPQPRCTWRRP